MNLRLLVLRELEILFQAIIGARNLFPMQVGPELRLAIVLINTGLIKNWVFVLVSVYK